MLHSIEPRWRLVSSFISIVSKKPDRSAAEGARDWNLDRDRLSDALDRVQPCCLSTLVWTVVDDPRCEWFLERGPPAFLCL